MSGYINMEKEIWEGWTVGDFIDELESQADMIMDNRSWRVPFSSYDDLTAWCIDNQPYYKNRIPEVIDYFAQKYNL